MNRAKRTALTAILGLGSIGSAIKLGTEIYSYPIQEIVELRNEINSLNYTKQYLETIKLSENDEFAKQRTVLYLEKKAENLKDKYESAINKSGSLEYNKLSSIGLLASSILLGLATA